jgi:hypothetical protein
VAINESSMATLEIVDQTLRMLNYKHGKKKKKNMVYNTFITLKNFVDWVQAYELI